MQEEQFIALCEILKTTPDFLLLGTIHPCNISQNIIDNLLLCSPEDIELTGKIIELMVERNQDIRNKYNLF